jgi:hypothetical protein
MESFASRFGRWIAVLALAALFAVPGGSAWAQSSPADYEEPYRELQIAYANGFEAAVEFIQKEMKEGRLDQKRLDELAANKGDRLRRLVVRRAQDYQQALIGINRPRLP